MSLSLVNRVSLFFIGALALVLVAYSATLFGFLYLQEERRFKDELQSALRTLFAAVEVESDDVKWEPSDHRIDFSRFAGDIRWIVTDEQGLVVDRSQNLLNPGPADAKLLEIAKSMQTTHGHTAGGGQSRRSERDWEVWQYWSAAVTPKPAAERDSLEREAIFVTAARPAEPLYRSLGIIGMTIVGVSLVIGVLASAVVRWLCRRALEPVRAMASEARAMVAGEPGRRLPVAATRDELAELGEAFNSVLDRFFETLTRQRRFAGDAAHQLRTPLTAVIGQLDVALRRTRSPDEYRETLSVVREQADELHRLVESMLFLARAEGDAALPDATTFDAAAWLRDYAATWSTHARHVDLRFDFGPTTNIRASRVLLKQLLDNLVSNALKYSEPGRPVSVAARSVVDESVGNAWELAVVDDGIGIAAEDLAAVFTPFFRSAEARRSGTAGTGLGLAVASRIAAALGGKLTCTSRLGHGSRFTLTLPTA